MRKTLAVLSLTLLIAALAGPLAPACQAQATYAGTGPGSYIDLGVTASGFESGQYGNTRLAGGTLFLDANLYRRIGVEAEARSLKYNSTEGLHETNYLVGPKISAMGHTLRPYAKFLVGRGDFRFPFGYAYGKYFMMAPGAGLDWHIKYSRLTIRVVDFEYQVWPDFTFGAIHPYGVSTGISWHVFAPGARER
jgi:hypothetical protein